MRLPIPKQLEEIDSEFNGKIEVWEVGKNKKLSVEGIVQSATHTTNYSKKSVWGGIHNLILEEFPAAKNILIMGLGGATVQNMLNDSLPDLKQTTVEIDSKMVEIAKKYFGLDSLKNHRVIISDVLRVLAEPEKFNFEKHSFDIVLIDVYCGEKYPDLGDSGAFLAKIKELADHNGLVIFNRIYLKHHQDDVDIFIGRTEEQFENVQTKTIAGHTNSDNILIFGRNMSS